MIAALATKNDAPNEVRKMDCCVPDGEAKKMDARTVKTRVAAKAGPSRFSLFRKNTRSRIVPVETSSLFNNVEIMKPEITKNMSTPK